MEKIFRDRHGAYPSGHQSTGCPTSASGSMTSSFYSSSSWDSSDITTPPSTRRTSFDSVKLEDMSFSAASTPERYGNSNGLSMNSMTHDMSSGFPDHSMLFPVDSGKILPDQTMMGYSFSTYGGPVYESFEAGHGLPGDTPSLEMDLYSPTSGMGSSPVSMDFVVPSQTTFVDTYGMNSPMRPTRALQFDSPASDYATDFSLNHSPAGSMKYFMLSYDDAKSTSTTPSRPSTLRQPIFEPLQSSAALHRVQAESQAVRHTRKRMKRESTLPGNIRVQKQAKKECPWEGCNGKFQRQEHLKRHEKTHTNNEAFPCQFCHKIFGRSDNLKSHIWLHANPNKKSSRTEHFAEAAKVYAEMSRKCRKSGDGVKIVESSVKRSRDVGY